MESATILLVEDHAPTLQTLMRVLTEEGYRVVGAPDALRACESMRERRPSLVISDVRMPGMDGLLLCQRLRECAETRRVPVFLYTASSVTASERRVAEQLGVSAILLKPVSLATLLDAIRAALAAAAAED